MVLIALGVPDLSNSDELPFDMSGEGGCVLHVWVKPMQADHRYLAHGSLSRSFRARSEQNLVRAVTFSPKAIEHARRAREEQKTG